MSASMNLVILIGNLGKDPETRYNPEGAALTNFNIATTESWKDKSSGEKQEKTEWHRIVAFGRLAEICGEYLKKGSQVCIRGKLTTRKWTNKEGKEQYTTEIVAAEMKMLGSKPAGEDRPSKPAGNGKPAEKKSAGKFDDMDDDIPFVSCALGDDYTMRKLHWGHQ